MSIYGNSLGHVLVHVGLRLSYPLINILSLGQLILHLFSSMLAGGFRWMQESTQYYVDCGSV